MTFTLVVSLHNLSYPRLYRKLFKVWRPRNFHEQSRVWFGLPSGLTRPLYSFPSHLHHHSKSRRRPSAISLLPAETVEPLPSFSHLQIFHLNPEMASEDPNPDSDPYQTPTLALKQALCFSCWDISSNLSRGSACKRVSYCSAKCQKQDWNRNHKKICKKLVAFNKQKGYVPSAGRHWNDYYNEQVHYLARRASRF